MSERKHGIVPRKRVTDGCFEHPVVFFPGGQKKHGLNGRISPRLIQPKSFSLPTLTLIGPIAVASPRP
jgi:hypothetical protein